MNIHAKGRDPPAAVLRGLNDISWTPLVSDQ
jgi:hypothetical protein